VSRKFPKAAPGAAFFLFSVPAFKASSGVLSSNRSYSRGISMIEKSMLERTLFADTLDASWPERARRGWTTLTSFGLQAFVTGVLLVLPLLRPSGFPSFHHLAAPISLGEPLDEPPAVAPPGRTSEAPSEPSKFFFRRPSPMPTALRTSGDEGPPAIANSGSFVPGGVRADPRGVANLFDNSSRSVLPAALPPAAPAKLLRLSHISEGSLVASSCCKR
jgi:hypothetical protein